MKKISITIFCIISLVSCKEGREILLSRHENGQKHEILILDWPISADSTGKKRIFYSNGKLHAEGGYKNGKRHGEWNCYYENGALKWRTTFINGVETGIAYCKYQDGTWKEVEVSAGQENGKTVEYNYDSITKQFFYVNGHYKNGLEQGEWIYSDSTNQIIALVTFNNGEKNGRFIRYHENGEVDMLGQMKNGRFHDTIKSFDKTGRLIKLDYCENGLSKWSKEY